MVAAHAALHRLPALKPCAGCDRVDVELTELRRWKVLTDIERRATGFAGHTSDPARERLHKARPQSSPPPASEDVRTLYRWLALFRSAFDPLRAEALVTIARRQECGAMPCRATRETRDALIASGAYDGWSPDEIAHVEGVKAETLRPRRGTPVAA